MQENTMENNLKVGLANVANAYAASIAKGIFHVYSFKTNGFSRDFYKALFAPYGADASELTAKRELFDIIRCRCEDDQYLQIRCQYDMTITFEYTATTTLGKEALKCVDAFQSLMDTKHSFTSGPPSHESSTSDPSSSTSDPSSPTFVLPGFPGLDSFDPEMSEIEMARSLMYNMVRRR